MIWFVFDVESVGLHGEAFAVGWSVVDSEGAELDSGIAACPISNANGSDSDRAWVEDNTPPLPVTHSTPAEVRAVFWKAWRAWADKRAYMVADCAWPVEARFLAACVDVDPEARRWQGPYPLLDVATARLMSCLDPLGAEGREPRELPKHDPLADARQSARLWIEAMERRR